MKNDQICALYEFLLIASMESFSALSIFAEEHALIRYKGIEFYLTGEFSFRQCFEVKEIQIEVFD